MTTDQFLVLLGILLSAGLGSFLRGRIRAVVVRWGRRRHLLSEQAEQERQVAEHSQHMAEIDGSLLTVVRARDELEDDNRRLREQLVEERRMRVEDQAQHERERLALRAEIDRLEAKLRDLLTEVQALKQRSDR